MVITLKVSSMDKISHKYWHQLSHQLQYAILFRTWGLSMKVMATGVLIEWQGDNEANYHENAAKNYTVLSINQGIMDHYEHSDLDYVQFYINDSDQAIVARQRADGAISCFMVQCLALKNSVFFNDWEQNFDLGNRLIHRNNDPSQSACEGRRGFADFIDTQKAKEGLEDVVRCMDDYCEDQEDCLVITGHSQGGATATIASILLYDWQPTVVTFGQPPAVDPGCEWIPSHRFYRYINSKVEDNEDDDLGFDVVPFVPTIVSGSAHYGHALLLGDDVDGGSAIKYLGFNEIDFEPALFDLDVGAHTMAAADAGYSYEARINAIVDTFQDSDMTRMDFPLVPCASTGSCVSQVVVRTMSARLALTLMLVPMARESYF